MMFRFLFFVLQLRCFCVDCCVMLRELQVLCVTVVSTVKKMSPPEVHFACDIIIVKFRNSSYIVLTIKCVFKLIMFFFPLLV